MAGAYWADEVSFRMGFIIVSLKAADLRLVSEGTRLLNIDFPSVDGYGSQFKVESMMFQRAKRESFILVSSSRAQVITLRHPKLPCILNGS